MCYSVSLLMHNTDFLQMHTCLESDSSDGLIPELSSLGSKGIGGSKRSRQKTLFEAVQ